MHSNDVLLEIVESRPFFVRVPAFRRGAFVRLRLAIPFEFVDAFEVPVEIVHSDEALCTCAARLCALERLVMLEHVLSKFRPLVIECKSHSDLNILEVRWAFRLGSADLTRLQS